MVEDLNGLSDSQINNLKKLDNIAMSNILETLYKINKEFKQNSINYKFNKAINSLNFLMDCWCLSDPNHPPRKEYHSWELSVADNQA